MKVGFKNFGEFITTKRLEKKIALREMARRLNIAAPYYSDIEKDRRNAPSKEMMDHIANILVFSDEDRKTMYDLAGKKRSEVSADLPDYIMERDYVRVALRTARDMQAGEKEWMKFIEELKQRKA